MLEQWIFVAGALLVGGAQAAILIASRPASLASGRDLLWATLPAVGLAALVWLARGAL